MIERQTTEQSKNRLVHARTWNGEFPQDLNFVFWILSKVGTPYLVGPSVRDALCHGDISKLQRYDIVLIGASIKEAEQTVIGSSANSFFIARPERTKKYLSFPVQSASDGSTIRKYVVAVLSEDSSLQKELLSREVTVNSLAMDSRARILSPKRALEDLDKGLIRPTYPPEEIFTKRPVFMLKIAKHIAYHGYPPTEDTFERAKRLAAHILDVPPRRWRADFERMLVNLYPAQGLDFLEQTGLLKFILPEVQAIIGFHKTCPVHHKDVWEHTKKVVQEAKAHVVVRWAALMHDTGKAWTRTIEPDGSVHFYRHEDMSALLFDAVAHRFGIEQALAQKIRLLIVNHPRVNQYSSEWSDSAVRRLIRDLGDSLDDMLALSRADITSKQEKKVKQLRCLLFELEERINKIKEEDSKPKLLPKGTGHVIMRHFGLSQGPVVGQLRKVLEHALEKGALPPNLPIESYMGYLEDYLRSQNLQTKGSK